MKYLLLTSMCLLSGAALSACKTTMEDGPRKVIVQDGYYNNGHPGTFCPPGQAKKGNC